MRHRLGTALILLALHPALPLAAVDKNGVSPQAISLPSGPGSIQGLGESFQPQLNGGGASHGIALSFPAGAAGHRPDLRLAYEAGAENGAFGLGWKLAGVFSVCRNTDRGVPRYVDGANGLDDDLDGITDNPEEVDVLSGMDREELVPLSDGSHRAETEMAFTRYDRSAAGWLARRKDGTRFELGMSAAARIEGPEGVFAWLLERIVDTNGNTIDLEYSTDPGSPGQKYLRRVRWGGPQASFAAVLTHESGRPDVFTDFRAGFEVRTALRVSRIDVVSRGMPRRADALRGAGRPGALRGDLDGDGTEDALVRRWALEYRPGAPVSLLTRVTQLGCDGATALPPLAMEYTGWTPPTDAVALLIGCSGEPAETLSSPSVELIDMNGDALPDLLTTSGSTHRAAMNLGTMPGGLLEWAPLAAVGNAPTIDISSTRAHLADATADGLADLVVKVSNTRFLCFDNTSQNSWTPSAFPLRNTDTWPIWPFDGTDGVASRSMDVDYNRQNDVLFTSQSGYSLWMLLPGGQYAREVRPEPVLCEGKTFRFDLPGTQIADMNGDRLQDLVWVQASRVVWFPSLGRGRFGDARFLPLGASLTAADIEKSGFTDLDDDGLQDLTVVRPASATRSVLYWMNRFETGLDGPRRLDGLPAVLTGDVLRWADMNGNGSSDIVISNSARPAGQRILVVELVPDGKPHLLSRTDNGLGLVMTLEHETSVDQMVRARQEGRAWSAAMPLSIPVVRRIIEDDGLGNRNEREITYRDPFWDPAKQEFRGFRAAQLREVGDDTATDRVTRHLFDAGDGTDCLKGKLLLEEVLDETGKVYVRTESSWSSRMLEAGVDGREVCFAFAESTDTVHIEGIEDAVTTRVERDFDPLGNPTVDRNLGIVGRSGDEVVVLSEYDLRPADWIMDRLSRKRILDGAGRTVAEERMVHDARGRLVRTEKWLDTGNRFITTERHGYDAHGNIIETTDALGHRRSWTFDDLLRAFPIVETVHLEDRDLTVRAGYDLAFGAVLSAEDFAEAASSYEYDALGRLVAIRRPGGAAELYTYALGAPVSRTLTRRVEDGGGTHNAWTFSDGYGRALARKSEAGGGRWRVLNALAYNSRKLESRRWLAWLSATSDWEPPDPARPHSVTHFDAEKRPIEKRLSDGSFERTVHEPLRSHHHDANDTAGEGLPVTREMDGRGRLVAVVERLSSAELTTRYAWSALDDLVGFTDAQGNVRETTFDSLRRRIAVNDPDSGRKAFAYDDAGNLVRTVEPGGASVEYGHDFANRVVTEDYLEPGAVEDPVDVRYRYDVPGEDLDLGDRTLGTATFTGGRLAAILDLSGEEHRSYDARGNPLWTLKRLRDPRTGAMAGFTTRFEHDILDRLVGLGYPDGDRLRLLHDEATLLSRIDGGPGGRVVVGRFTHSDTAQIAGIEYGNGVHGEFTYDDRERLRSIRVAGPDGSLLLHDVYDRDRASNMKRIDDLRAASAMPLDSPLRRSASFTHDELHRLTSVSYGETSGPPARRGRIDYAHDGIGNLLSRTTPPRGQSGHLEPREDLAFGAFVHGGGTSGRTGRLEGDPPGPHAVTLGVDGREYLHDDRGNTTGIGGARLAWDSLNRLVEHEKNGVLSSYVHDHAGRRVTALVTGQGQDELTFWPSPWFEVRPGNAPVKYVLAGDRRIARVKGALDPAAARVQRIWLAEGWNAVTVAVQQGGTVAAAFGPDATVYIASGRSFTRLDGGGSLPLATALLVLVDAPRVAALRGAYSPPTSSFELAASAGYAPWPLLEPLEPSIHLEAAPRLHVLDAAADRWSMADPSLPSFLGTARRGDASGALWVGSTEAVVDPRATENEDIVFYHDDHLGSTVLVTDGLGEAIEETVHAPFGAVLARAFRGTADVAYGFTGKERSPETGLTYFGARHYDASICRFLGVDPARADVESREAEKLADFLSDPRQLSTYSYAANSPLRYVDPDGREIYVEGPKATEFVDMLSRYSGLNLKSNNGFLELDASKPFRKEGAPESQQQLVFSLVKSKELVMFLAYPGAHDRNSGGSVGLPMVLPDSFKGFEQGSSSEGWQEITSVVHQSYTGVFLKGGPGMNTGRSEDTELGKILQEHQSLKEAEVLRPILEAFLLTPDPRPAQRPAPRVPVNREQIRPTRRLSKSRRASMRSPLLVTFLLVVATLHAADKNGVAPQAISLPSGPGSIQGLGESFQPQLNTGSGGYSVPLPLPKGPGGMTPRIALAYGSGAGNGPAGLGWSLSGLPSIRRNTDRGVPLYVDGPDGADNDLDGTIDNPGELDTYTGIDGEELVPLPDGTFRAENEGAFALYRRSGAGWEARTRDGGRMLFGVSAAGRVEDSGRVFEWRLERKTDKNGNAIDYEYVPDPATPAMKYPRRIRWGAPAAFFAVVLEYEEGRPDVFSSFRSCFELRTTLRLAAIHVFSQGIPAPALAVRGDLDGDGMSDALIRRWRLDYEPDAHISLLARITQLGADGATALPSLSFGYSRWTPIDNAAASLIRSRDAPPVGFESGSVELIDMNGDGLPDLLSTAGSVHRAHLNRGVDTDGRLAWGPGTPVGNAPSIDIVSDRTHLADATSDGLSDLLVKVSNTTFQCYDNTSRNSWTTAPFPLGNTDTWPIWPLDGEAGKLSRSIDCDYSRSNDVLHTSSSGNRLWMLLPEGRYASEQRLPPLTCDGKVFRFDLPGTHIADLNGDRLQDLAWIEPSRVAWFPSRGRGDFAAPIIYPLGRTLTAAEIERSGFSDVDGDGLVDFTVVRPGSLPNGLLYWLNRFQNGFDGPRSLLGLPAQSTGDALRWADMNGNGTTDIAISQAQSASGEKVLVIDLIPGGKVHLLERIENGLGLTVTLEYESSVTQMTRAEASGAPWTSTMPLPVTVLSRIAEDDGLGHVHDNALTYRDPYYDPVKQEFRGFAAAEAREAGDSTAETRVTVHAFDTGRDTTCLKGKTLSTEVRGDGGTLFTRTESAWEERLLADGIDGRQVCFPIETAADEYVHEGEASGVRLRREMDHDDHGNVVAERRLGIVDSPGDEVITERAFDLRLGEWLLDLMSRETTRDGSGNRVAEQRFHHDARGNLERVEAWLDIEDRMVPALRQSFDAFGNIVESLDPRGNRRTFDFDPLVHAWPVVERVHLAGRELSMTAEVDLGFGVALASTSFSGEETSYEYDALGRLIAREMPGGAGESYEYHLSSPVSHVIKRRREDTQGAAFESYMFSDGLGRPLLTKIEADGGRWRALSGKSYNARKLEAGAWFPFESASPAYEAPDPGLPHDLRFYDGQGRVVRTNRADGSTSRVEHSPLAQAVYDGNDTAAGGSPDIHTFDGLGRRTSVEERNGAQDHVTRYGWNARGNLETIVDALGNTKRFRFDSLSRLVEVDDPDRGLLRFSSDDAGNRVRREDSRSRVITWSHDAANRILEKIHRAAGPGGADLREAAYHYDAPAGEVDFGDGTRGIARNVLGRLAWVEDASGEEHFSYDERGNVEWVLKRIRDARTGLLVSYRTERRYDLMDRESEIVYPDNDRLRCVHDEGSFVTRIDGGPSGEVILADADHAPSGQPASLLLGNGARSTFEYDPSQRLERLRTVDGSGAEILRQRLAYDAASNVISITDERPPAAVPADSPRRATAQFVYDELHRLTQVRYGQGGGGGRIDYAYDALGNLLSQTTPPSGSPGHIADPSVNLGALAYAGGRSARQGRRPGDPPGPHAATGSAGGPGLAYDSNGNLTGLGAAALAWDFEDRMAGYSRAGVDAAYTYDHAGRRVARQVIAGGASDVTHYPDRAFEVRRGAPVKYVFLEERRVARVEGRLDPARDAVQRIVLAQGWNLIAAAVESGAVLRDAFGADAAFYEARGSTYAALGGGLALPAGKALWVHAPSARVAVLRGAAPSGTGGPSAGPLHAWPLLEPFRPAAHIQGDARLMVFDATTRRWLRRDDSLPAFLSTAPVDLAPAQAFWSPGEIAFGDAGAAGSGAVFYHQDHLGSTAALTDATGTLIEERTYYPFGAARNIHRPGAPVPTDYELTGKERDPESGLVAMGARGYLDIAGMFLSPDPRFAEAARLGVGSDEDRRSLEGFLSNPQMGNLYAYALRNPLRYIDPAGLEVVISPALRDTPAFMKAWKMFEGTKEGQRLLKSLDAKGVKTYMRASKAGVKDAKVGNWTTALGQQYTGPAEGKNLKDGEAAALFNIYEFQKAYGSKGRDRLVLEMANAIHHELRHAEADFYKEELATLKKAYESLETINKAMGGSALPTSPYIRTNAEVHQNLDQYNRPNDDPYNAEFAKEINLPSD